MDVTASAPEPDCQLCPRLAAFRSEQRTAHDDWFNSPVPAFGDRQAQLLIAGLAPGLRGANRTGRPFTGDYAGDLLYETLGNFGFTVGTYDARPDDGLALTNCIIINAVRCVPPQNKPTPQEIRQCNDFLASEITSLPRLNCILALGRIAHEAVLTSQGLVRSRYKFAHNARHELPGGLSLIDSYHCSRYNTNTGRLTPEMFSQVFDQIASLVDS
ncbi:MAG: uracil-DNA glycosylase [Aestuariivirgaceae bacterium]